MGVKWLSQGYKVNMKLIITQDLLSLILAIFLWHDTGSPIKQVTNIGIEDKYKSWAKRSLKCYKTISISWKGYQEFKSTMAW